MKKNEMKNILCEAAYLSDDEILKAYYGMLLDSSVVDRMYELGYDVRDIVEREKYEAFMQEKCGIYESICLERGLKLFE